MNKLHLPKIEALPQVLVNPERFGQLAMSNVVELPLPETIRLYSPDAA